MKAISLFKKIVTCFVAGIVTAALLLLLGNSGTIWWFPPPVVFSLVGISFVLALAFPYIWQYNETKGSYNSIKIHAWLCALIRYCIALDIAGFGWKKIFGLQFVVPLAMAEQPMNQQTGEWLTWYYFGHSLAFASIIAAIQIGGSILLLFRKTVLIGAIILFSLMLNITLINIFYHMNTGGLVQSVVMTIGIVFLILLDYKRLIDFFLKSQSNLAPHTLGSSFTKNIIPWAVILLPLLFTIYLSSMKFH